MRHSRPRLDYELGSSASQYGDAYGDRFVIILFFVVVAMKYSCIVVVSGTYSIPIVIGRLGRSAAGYGGSRSSISSQDSHGMYSSRRGMGYGGVFLVAGKLI